MLSSQDYFYWRKDHLMNKYFKNLATVLFTVSLLTTSITALLRWHPHMKKHIMPQLFILAL